MKKAGVVTIVGRPNVGKSTLLNNLLGQKVSITSPKPQTTRFPIQAVYEDERGQIIFVDTPGIFGKATDPVSQKINQRAQDALSENIAVILYLIDHTRPRNFEENRMLGLVRKLGTQKILVINKVDLKEPDYSAEYAFYEDEFTEIVRVSALKRTNFNILLEKIFSYLPEGHPLVKTDKLVQPALNVDSKLFIRELIREKAFLFTRDEVPYTIDTHVEIIEERPNNRLYVKGSIITTNDTYKKMIIGRGGRMIKKIGMAVRKELETATGKHVFVDLRVEVNPRWMEML